MEKLSERRVSKSCGRRCAAKWRKRGVQRAHKGRGAPLKWRSKRWNRDIDLRSCQRIAGLEYSHGSESRVFSETEAYRQGNRKKKKKFGRRGC